MAAEEDTYRFHRPTFAVLAAGAIISSINITLSVGDWLRSGPISGLLHSSLWTLGFICLFAWARWPSSAIVP